VSVSAQVDLVGPALIDVISEGLSRSFKELPARVLYDETGSRLFEQITRLPEYYPTEAERSLLVECASEVFAMSRARTLVEFGAGVQDKTGLLIATGTSFGSLACYQPIDISSEVLFESAKSMGRVYPDLDVQPVVGDFTTPIALPESPRPRLTCFLGGTIGNLHPAERIEFLNRMGQMTGAGGYVLVGTDLLKDIERIVRAYDDSEGVTAAFLLNVIDVVNNECNTTLDKDDFEYVPLWDALESRMDLRLRARRPQDFVIGEQRVHVAAGEEIRIEVSTKFTLEQVREECEAAGLRVEQQFRNEDFALTLAQVA
jgi:L-histidine Nalpha-methyltransferase